MQMNPPRLPAVFISPLAVPPNRPPIAMHIAQAAGSIRSMIPNAAPASSTISSRSSARLIATSSAAVIVRQLAAIRLYARRIPIRAASRSHRIPPARLPAMPSRKGIDPYRPISATEKPAPLTIQVGNQLKKNQLPKA
ncbi:MAG: hypothetical protein PGN08_03840 [Sphingomonas taxi]